VLGLVIIPRFVNCWCEEMLRRDKGVYRMPMQDYITISIMAFC